MGTNQPHRAWPSAAKARRVLAAAGIAGALAVGIAACGDDEESGGGAAAGDGGGEAKTYTIGVAMKTQLQRRWGFDVKAMQDQAAKTGDKLIVQYANDDPAAQADQVENLLSQGIDALIIVPVDDKAAGALADQARNQKVPVVSYDIAVRDTEIDFFVERDNEQAGLMQIEAAKKAVPEGKYALLKGDAAVGVAQIMTSQWKEKLEGDGDVQVVYDQWIKNFDPGTAQSRAEDVLSRNNDDVDAFLSLNDGMATGIAQALAGRNLDGKVFLSGLDADPANLELIASGAQTMTVYTPVDDEAVAAVEAARALAAGETPESDATFDNGAGQIPTARIEVEEINQDNLCEFVAGGLPEGWVEDPSVLKPKGKACS
ncbi:MAG: substrate-binding domain-containing protein [Solirubrobacterales bacterium]|nr:substrate-binding domain-containing protein [Solirubrobacterales bacterium]